MSESVSESVSESISGSASLSPSSSESVSESISPSASESISASASPSPSPLATSADDIAVTYIALQSNNGSLASVAPQILLDKHNYPASTLGAGYIVIDSHPTVSAWTFSSDYYAIAALSLIALSPVQEDGEDIIDFNGTQIIAHKPMTFEEDVTLTASKIVIDDGEITNLNANLLQGNLATDFAESTHTHTESDVTDLAHTVFTTRFVYGEDLTDQIPPGDSIYDLDDEPIDGTVRLYVNGLRLLSSAFDVSGKELTYTPVLDGGDYILVDYNYVSGGYGGQPYGTSSYGG